jgi:Flp pilus assembly protein TadG
MHITRLQRFSNGDRRDDSGQSLVEFAFVSPIFFLLLFALIQFGLIMGGQNGVVNAVRETARYAATYQVASNADVVAACGSGKIQAQFTAALARAVPGFVQSQVVSQVTYSWQVDPNGRYYPQLAVRATYDFPLYVPLVSFFIDRADGIVNQKLALSATEKMRIENNEQTAPTSPPTGQSCYAGADIP